MKKTFAVVLITVLLGACSVDKAPVPDLSSHNEAQKKLADTKAKRMMSQKIALLTPAEYQGFLSDLRMTAMNEPTVERESEYFQAHRLFLEASDYIVDESTGPELIARYKLTPAEINKTKKRVLANADAQNVPVSYARLVSAYFAMQNSESSGREKATEYMAVKDIVMNDRTPDYLKVK